MKTKTALKRRFITTFGLFSLISLQACSVNPLVPAETLQLSDSEPSTQLAKEPAVATIQTAYNSIILNSQTRQPITPQQLTAQLKGVDVVFLGEFHGNHASHWLQAQLQNLLYQQHPNQVLSMEQFNRDQQPILNRYLDGEIGEAYLVNEAPAWDNYTASYRPLVEFAKQHFLPVIAANAPADTVRCIGRQGEAYLEKLTTEEASLIAQQPLQEVEGYRALFMNFMDGSSHFDEGKANNSYLAQLSRDNTMAESILKALQANPGAQVIHTNGAFHSDKALGTVGALKRLDPTLNIKILSPVHVDPTQPMQFSEAVYENGDYLYLLQPQPAKYQLASYRQQAFKRMFQKADAKVCK